MSTDQNGVEVFDQDPLASAPPRRGWWSRNWRWFVPTVLLTLVVLCCGCPLGFFYWAFNKVYDLEVFQVAMQKIQADAGLRRELGEPITIVRWPPPAFRIEDNNGSGEADVHWEIEGPKGRAKAHVQARLTNGRWDTQVLEVVLANGKKVLLADTGGANDAPVFKGSTPGTKKPETKGPAPEISLPMPPDDAPGKR
jgi:hypothetical protein